MQNYSRRSIVGRLVSVAASLLTLTAGHVLAAEPDRKGWPDKIRFGVVPTEGGADTRERFEPISKALQESLGVPVEIVSTSDYKGVVIAMENQQVEFGYFGPKAYIEAAKRAHAEALCVELNKDGERGYYSILIVPASSAIAKLEDAKGKNFAFTDPNSTSGYLIPATLIADQLKQPPEQFFGEVKFSGSHGTSILQVAAGELDIAATNDMDLNKMIEKGSVKREAVKVVYKSEQIPGSPIAGRSDLPQSLKDAFRDAMIKVGKDKSVRDKLQNGGYEPVNDEDYDVMRAAIAYLDDQTKKQK